MRVATPWDSCEDSRRRGSEQLNKDLKLLVGTPDIPLGWPVGADFTEKAVYVSDFYTFRVARTDMSWQAEETCEVK